MSINDATQFTDMEKSYHALVDKYIGGLNIPIDKIDKMTTFTKLEDEFIQSIKNIDVISEVFLLASFEEQRCDLEKEYETTIGGFWDQIDKILSDASNTKTTAQIPSKEKILKYLLTRALLNQIYSELN